MSDDLDTLKSHPAIPRLYASRMRLEFDGKEWVGNCPFPTHQDRTPSFKIYQKDGAWLWTCHGKCNATGNIYQFLQRLDNCNFQAAAKKVREFVQTSWDEKAEKVDKTFKTYGDRNNGGRAVSLTSDQWGRYESALGPAGLAYLQSRGLNPDSVRTCRVGFTPSIGKIAHNDAIADKGWLAFPCFRDGKVVNVKFRSIVEKAFAHLPGMEKPPWLFNTDSISGFEPVYVVEGEIDAMTLEQAGFRAVSLQSGNGKESAVTPRMIDALLAAEKILLAGDTDDTGSKAMQELWRRMPERTFLLKWPAGMKDANQTFLEHCKGDASGFRTLVEELTGKAASSPMPSVVNAAEGMKYGTRVNLAEAPGRLRFEQPTVDKMAIIMPGSVVSSSATNTKMGKTVFWTGVMLHNARRYGARILDYQCELSNDEMYEIIAANVLRKSRNGLTEEDYRKASEILSREGVEYYIGRDPFLTTVSPVLDLIEAAIIRLRPSIVRLDHIHFICRNEKDEIQAQANAMQRIKNMAVKYGVIFIVLAQPRKADKANKGKIIHVTDLKGSESVTSDADAIFAIHREAVKKRDETTRDDYDPQTKIHLLGARSKGPGGTFARLIYDGETATFFEPTTAEPPPNFMME